MDGDKLLQAVELGKKIIWYKKKKSTDDLMRFLNKRSHWAKTETMNLIFSAYSKVLKQYWKQELEVWEPQSCAYLWYSFG